MPMVNSFASIIVATGARRGRGSYSSGLTGGFERMRAEDIERDALEDAENLMKVLRNGVA